MEQPSIWSSTKKAEEIAAWRAALKKEIKEKKRNPIEKPKALAAWESFVKEPPKILYKKPLSIVQIAKKENVEIDQLEKRVKEQVVEYAKSMADKISYPHPEWMTLIDTLYNLFLHSTDTSLPKKLTWIKKMQSFDDFIEYFYPKVTDNAVTFMKYDIQSFLYCFVHPQQVVKNWNPRNWMIDEDGFQHLYDAPKQLIPLPYSSLNEISDYASPEVIDEVIELLQNDYKLADYNHVSGSASLKGIEKHQSILSSWNAIAKGEKVKTGEIGTRNIRDIGLRSVYVHNNQIAYGYSFLNWFNEFPVNFGINKKRQEEYLKKIGFSYSENDSEIFSKDLGSDGMLIGPEVPLEAVDLVYCWKNKIPEMKKWVRNNCPQAKIVSVEAGELITYYSQIINKIVLEENISPSQACEKLKKYSFNIEIDN